MTWQKIRFLFAVPYTVNRCNQSSVSVAANQAIARLSLARKNELGNIVFDHPLSYCLRFFTATSVPPAGIGTSRSVSESQERVFNSLHFKIDTRLILSAANRIHTVDGA
jgi:hypothetical protein